MAKRDTPPPLLTINISASGDPTPSCPTVTFGQPVQWQATPDTPGHYPVWFICVGPFREHVLVTHPVTGMTPVVHAGRSIGECFYKIISLDPTSLAKPKPLKKPHHKKPHFHFASSGGGIIIDS